MATEQTDGQRLQWLEDNLWNGWQVGASHDAGGPPTYTLWLSGWTDAAHVFEAPTLREVIDKAMDPDA